MNVAELQDPQAIEIWGQAGQRDVHFANLEVSALDESTVTYGGKRRGHKRASGGIEHAAAAGVHVGVQEAAHPGERLINRKRAGRCHQVGQRTGAQDAAHARGNTHPREHRGKGEGITYGHECVEEEEGIANPAAGRGAEQKSGNAPLHESEDNDQTKIQGIYHHGCFIFSRWLALS